MLGTYDGRPWAEIEIVEESTVGNESDDEEIFCNRLRAQYLSLEHGNLTPGNTDESSKTLIGGQVVRLTIRRAIIRDEKGYNVVVTVSEPPK